MALNGLRQIKRLPLQWERDASVALACSRSQLMRDAASHISIPLARPRFAVAALAVTQLMSWATLYYTFSMFLSPMGAAFGASQQAMMGALSLGLLCTGVTAVGVGVAIDRGYGRAVMSCGSLLAACALMLWSTINSVETLYVVWVLMGVALAMTLYDPAFAIVTHGFGTSYRNVIVILTLVGGFASTLSFPLTHWLIERFGWREALQCLAAINLVICLPLHLWALQRDPQARSEVLRSEGDAAPAALQTATTLRHAVTTRLFWALAVAFTLYMTVQAGVWMHLVPAMVEHGLSAAEAVFVIVFIGPAQVAGRVIQLLFARRMDMRALGRTVFMLSPIAMAVLAMAPGALWPHVAFACLFGLGNGIVTIVRGIAAAEFFGKSNAGSISGALEFCGSGARALAPWLVSLLLAGMGSYRPVLWTLAGLSVLAMAAFWVASRRN